MSNTSSNDPRLQQVFDFPLIEALFGRRSRRFALGMSIPGGPLAYSSPHDPLPLDELETALLVSAGTGITGWNFGIPFTMNDSERMSNYGLRLTGRAGPSATAINTAELFFTDDSGTYMTRTRDGVPGKLRELEARSDLERIITASQDATTQLSTQRLAIPQEPPHVDEHNVWNANVAGSTLFMPVGDVSQHMLALLALYVSNGYLLYDDYSDCLCGNLEPFIRQGVISDDPQKRLLLSRVEQGVYSSVAIELGLICENIVLMMQAIGLGGWMYTGISPYTLLGASARKGIPGLGFRFVEREDWPAPNPVGLDGYYESLCPPYVSDMYEAARLLARRKFEAGGTYDATKGGPYSSDEVLSSARPYTQAQVDCIGEMAEHVYRTYGRFPARYPTVLLRIYAQAQHIETEFYDQFLTPGAYLPSHAEHMARWHA
jgi:hypothetical protein